MKDATTQGNDCGECCVNLRLRKEVMGTLHSQLRDSGRRGAAAIDPVPANRQAWIASPVKQIEIRLHVQKR